MGTVRASQQPRCPKKTPTKNWSIGLRRKVEETDTNDLPYLWKKLCASIRRAHFWYHMNQPRTALWYGTTSRLGPSCRSRIENLPGPTVVDQTARIWAGEVHGPAWVGCGVDLRGRHPSAKGRASPHPRRCLWSSSLLQGNLLHCILDDKLMLLFNLCPTRMDGSNLKLSFWKNLVAPFVPSSLLHTLIKRIILATQLFVIKIFFEALFFTKYVSLVVYVSC